MLTIVLKDYCQQISLMPNRFGGAIDAARSAGRLARGRALEANNEVIPEVERPVQKAAPAYVPTFYTAGQVAPPPSPYLTLFRHQMLLGQ